MASRVLGLLEREEFRAAPARELLGLLAGAVTVYVLVVFLFAF